LQFPLPHLSREMKHNIPINECRVLSCNYIIQLLYISELQSFQYSASANCLCTYSVSCCHAS
jgi:hypothetical protein